MPAILPGSVIQFEDYRLDCGRFELLRNGRFLRVERKPMELLVLLASHEGEVVTRSEISQRLWSSEVFVDTEHGINTAIGKLRHVLRDDPDRPRFIQTITGMGYRFIAPVSAVEPDLQAEIQSEPAVAAAAPRSAHRALGWYVAAGICVALALGGFALYRLQHRLPQISYTQLTDFTDSAVAPALSPDGRMVAFIRSDYGFLTSDQIYVKMLPDGEARRVTDDSRPKYGPEFSLDGSQIAYTVIDGAGFSTYEVSVLGVEPHLLLKNAAGLVWLDPRQLLFSEIDSGVHLGVVTSTLTRADLREIYFPAHERAMAHYSFPSPDRRWALVVEMNGNGDWAPCRLVALQGHGSPVSVGPAGACTSAGWSPNGDWMYFTATVQGESHIWRQRFPKGKPEQITFGPTEEIGIAVEPAGQSLITSVGEQESNIWIHSNSGDRQLSSEGEVVRWPSPPVFTSEGSSLFYLLRTGKDSGAELMRTMVDSGQSEAVFPGVAMTAFDISPDGKLVVYTTAASGGSTQLWLAPIDRSSPPTKIAVASARSPHFGPRGQILFQQMEGNANYLEQIDAQINPGGSHPSKVFPFQIGDFMGISPSRRWVAAGVPIEPGKSQPAVMVIPLDGGTPRRVCASYCVPTWSTDGKFLFIPVEESSRTSPGRSLAIPLGPEESLPDIPAGGIPPLAEASVVRGAVSVGRDYLVPGKDPEHFAWVKTTVHRNLYEISLH